jgi:hypothetical protein
VLTWGGSRVLEDVSDAEYASHAWTIQGVQGAVPTVVADEYRRVPSCTGGGEHRQDHVVLVALVEDQHGDEPDRGIHKRQRGIVWVEGDLVEPDGVGEEQRQ